MDDKAPKFFVPGMDKLSDAEKVYEATAKHIKAPAPKKQSDRIWTLAWTRNGNKYYAQVGAPLEKLFGGEMVMAIFKQDNNFCICTPSNGVLGGFPIVVYPNNSPALVRFSE